MMQKKKKTRNSLFIHILIQLSVAMRLFKTVELSILIIIGTWNSSSSQLVITLTCWLGHCQSFKRCNIVFLSTIIAVSNQLAGKNDFCTNVDTLAGAIQHLSYHKRLTRHFINANRYYRVFNSWNWSTSLANYNSKETSKIPFLSPNRTKAERHVKDFHLPFTKPSTTQISASLISLQNC